jgi:hypothetical protein
MRAMRRVATLTAAAVLFLTLPSYAQTYDLKQMTQLKTLRTDDLRLVFVQWNGHLAPYLTRCFENSMSFHRELFDYTPSQEVTVLMQDFDDIGFAGATGVPYNWMTIGVEPYEYVYEVSPTNERINWVMSHELLHIVATDQAAASDRLFRALFRGKVAADDRNPVSLLYSYLTAPRMYAPRWYHEGTATFMETWMSGAIGRAIGGYDEMVFRTKVAEDAHFFRLVGLESEGKTTDFHIGVNAYLYGTRFVSYCAYLYGPEKIVDWVRRTDGTKRHYSAQFKHVFGKNLGDAWNEWIEWERGWQRANLDTIAQYPPTEYRILTDKPLGSVSRAYYNPESRKLYAAALFPNEFAHVAEIDVDTGERRKITGVRMPALFYVTSLAYDEASGRLFFTTDNSKGWRDLHEVDMATGESKQLFENGRTGDLAFNQHDGSVWGIQHFNGFSSVVRFGAPYDTYEHLLTLPYGYDLFDIDLSPDGQYFTACAIDQAGDRRLVRYSTEALQRGDTRRERLFEFRNKNTSANFVHSRDGRYLFGTSYYSGVSNVYRYDLDKRKMEIITNADTGYFRPVPVSDDSLIVFRYTAEGFLPVMIGINPIDSITVVEQIAPTIEEIEEKKTVRGITFLGHAIWQKHPVVDDWNIGTPYAIDLDSVVVEADDYHAFKNIRFTSIYPIVQSYKTRVAWGLRFNFRERNGLHFFEVDGLYTPSESLPTDERGHLWGRYIWGKWEFDGWYNRADFYDFFGPTKTARKGYSLGVTYTDYLVHERPRALDYTLSLTAYGGLETLPYYQNVQAVFEEYLSAYGQLAYSNELGTIGGLGKEKGITWNLNGTLNLINPQDARLNPNVVPEGADSLIRASSRHVYPQVWLDFSYGFRLPWAHSSLWLRPSLGQSFVPRSTPPEPLNNFFFGGFGNNWVDHRSVSRYRQFYAFPGIELNSLGGTNYAKLLVEWALPPVRFSRLGTPTIYLNSAHLSLFTTGIATNVDDGSLRRTLLNVGAQLDIKLVSLFSQPYTFSLGYAVAFEDNERYSDELMVSLKIF